MRTKRDNQQWMLDLALNMRGRVQNFERDDPETPTRAHNYRMLPKMWRKKAEHDEALAKTAEKNGFKMTNGLFNSIKNQNFHQSKKYLKTYFNNKNGNCAGRISGSFCEPSKLFEKVTVSEPISSRNPL